jgi:hypothetical protein
MSIDAERRLLRRDLALSYIEEALILADAENAAGPGGIPRSLQEDLEKRREKLEKSAV